MAGLAIFERMTLESVGFCGVQGCRSPADFPGGVSDKNTTQVSQHRC
jgi:hypothetical protein